MNGFENNDTGMNGLCKKCGRCCRVMVNSDHTYLQLKNLADDGDAYAIDFLNIFEPYSSEEAARAVDTEAVDNIINRLTKAGMYDKAGLTFYRCKYLTADNLCSIYEERPELCVKYPADGWVITPPNCGYESWLFMKRESDMQKIRRAKEELFDLKVMKGKTDSEDLLKKIETVQKNIHNKISRYSKYGSHLW